MGVKDLWQLLSPIGRRVSIETLEGKTLAIDASIWITQFIKAMRDEEGKMRKNAHLIGTLRRILRLLYHRIRPLFVFDGATPELKLRTVRSRRNIRESQEESKKVAAQRILRAQLKQHAAMKNNESNFVSSFHRVGQNTTDNDKQNSSKRNINMSQEQSIEDEEDVQWLDGYENLRGKNMDGEGTQSSAPDEDTTEDFQWQLPSNTEDLSIDVLSSLPAHMRKSLIEEARKRQRTASRATYLPVAANPALYSQTQLSNFLASSQLNKKFTASQAAVTSSSAGTGISIAAEGHRKYQLVPRSEIGKLSSNASSSQEQQESGLTQDSAGVVDERSVGSQEEDDAFWEPQLLPTPPAPDGGAAELESEEDAYWEPPMSSAAASPQRRSPTQPLTSTTIHAPITGNTAATASKDESPQDRTVPAAAMATVTTEKEGHSIPKEGYLDLSYSSSESDQEKHSAETHEEGSNMVDDALLLREGGELQKREGMMESIASMQGAEQIQEEDDDVAWESDSSSGHSLPASSPPHTSQYTDSLLSRGGFVLEEEDRDMDGQGERSRLSADAASRAISTAASMADWAGRAVRNALKAHLRPEPAVSSPPPSQTDKASPAPTLPQEDTSNQSKPVGSVDNELLEDGFITMDSLLVEDAEAQRQRARSLRDAESLTDELKAEVIELLQLMDLPYLVAPFEAEAQCAVLEQLGLVDGIVTEDSDALLFGAETVYRNIFSDKKYVEVYLAEDARKEMGLYREDLVSLAYFLGSDYAEGVLGVGIVNAVEILHAFPMHPHRTAESSKTHTPDPEEPLQGLRRFKEWLQGYDFEGEFLGDPGNASSSSAAAGTSCSSKDSSALAAFTQKHQNGRSKWTLPQSFPDPRIARAYLFPEASRNPQPFAWTQPSPTALKEFCLSTLGWTSTQADAAIDPVLSRYAQRSSQSRIDAYFLLNYEGDTRFAKITSDRLREAVVQITGKRTNLALGGSGGSSSGKGGRRNNTSTSSSNRMTKKKQKK